MAQLFVVLSLTSLNVMNLGNILKWLPIVGDIMKIQHTSNGGDPNQLSDFSGSSAYNAANNLGSNLARKYTSSGLTDAELEANAWTAQREDTVHQREVADLKAAGLNPVLSVSSGGSPSSTSVAPNPMNNLGALLQLVTLPSQLKNMSAQNSLLAAQRDSVIAQKDNIAADTALKNSQTSETVERERGTRIVNDFNERTAEDRAAGIKIANSLSSAQERSVYKGIDEMDAHIKQMLADASTAESKIALTWSQNVLARANARQVAELLPIEKAYKMAATDEARAAALLSGAHTAYQNKLIDDGFVDAYIKDMESRASMSFSESQLKAIKTALRTGNVPDGLDIGLKSGEPALKWFLQPLAIILDNYNPLNDLFK